MQFCLIGFPNIVMATVVLLMLCFDFVHDLLSIHFWLFYAIAFPVAGLQVGVSLFLFSRDKQLATQCFVAAFIVVLLLVLSIPPHAPRRFHSSDSMPNRCTK